MTDATAPELYPQYCFQLSPTINRWCHFRIADILTLRSHPGFQGQDVYFHANHPIKWVRICGIVVAVDERETRHFYTIDDGSGATLECVVNVAPRPAPGTAAAGQNAFANQQPNAPKQLPAVDAPVDVGHLLDIKGSVGTFRENWQIRAEKIAHLRSTEQEVAFWEKVALLKRDVLSKAWHLDPREVRKCRKEEEGRSTAHRDKRTSERRERKHRGSEGLKKATVYREQAKVQDGVSEARRERAKARAARVTGLERSRPTERVAQGESERKQRGEGLTWTQTRVTGLERKAPSELASRGEVEGKHKREPLAKRPARVTGLEKRRTNKPVMGLIPVTGKYDALGL